MILCVSFLEMVGYRNKSAENSLFVFVMAMVVKKESPIVSAFRHDIIAKQQTNNNIPTRD